MPIDVDSISDTSTASPASESPNATTTTAGTTPVTSEVEAEIEIVDKDGNTLVTDTMLKEEEKLHQQTEKETAKVMQEESRNQFDQGIKEQRMKRLNFLLSKSSAYATILSEKLKRQQDEAREKAAKLDAARRIEEARLQAAGKEGNEADENKRAAEGEQEQEGEGSMAMRRRSGRTNIVIPAPPPKKTKTAAKKRKAGDEEYQLEDLINEEVGGSVVVYVYYRFRACTHITLEIKRRKQDSPDPVTTTSIFANTTMSTASGQAGPDPIKKIKPSISARQPSLVTGGMLREYQLAGVEWLVSLWENGLNGILADEMGLGKTLQTIAFIAHLKGMNVSGPFLIVTPLSTLANWVSEFQRYYVFHNLFPSCSSSSNRLSSFSIFSFTHLIHHHARFTPTIPVLLFHGNKDERAHMINHKLKKNKEATYEFPVVVTSYEIVMNDRKYLQNNLAELWSLLNFLLPDIFDDLDMFQSWFDFSDLHQKSGQERIMREEDENHIVSSLHMILKPFLLRRLKNDVEHDLPKKKEYLLYAPLTKAQKEIYDAILDRNIRGFLIDKKAGGENPETTALNDGKENNENGQSGKTKGKTRTAATNRVNYKEMTDAEWFKMVESDERVEEEVEYVLDNEAVGREYQKRNAVKAVGNLKLQNLVMQLRKVCNHPFLFDWPLDPATNEPVVSSELVNQSGKIMMIDRLLPALFERGHKVLIFSQMTKMLDILQDWVTVIKGWKTCRLDGSVPQEERRKQIAEFNDPKSDCMLFLLSTRAGGLGINLTAADTVVIFDSDWNPQMDLQAQDRVHRIGQTKPVLIYRLVIGNTVESKILEKASAKRRLEKLVIQKGKFKVPTAGTQESRSTLLELAEILASEDGEKVHVATEGDRVISDDDLEKLLDRSPTVFEAQTVSAQGAFREIEESELRDVKSDALATRT
ncbi:P-loop containing nucleoside triphosphate hydrolase protein [Jimgerdemannia flammicorona]|uniref:P-loop containing nucleoside triphosphate hydrolase protein n=1 Tax=Jimgerdemannia flammicorona TaxID=994334 RepID=A0A433QTC4_9FUNG|nr:P-loop containing nucleoside triphosphate hydrolase protein [Jimgerdemannia flammicorona]